MNWITRLFAEIQELVAVMANKLNTLNTNKEDKTNKKQDLASTDVNHYPSVPAVNVGLTNTLQSAQTYTDSKIQANNGNYIPLSQKGANNGVAELDATGKVPTNQLPSYVDDVVDLVNIVTANPTSGMVAGSRYYNSTTKKIFTASSATVGVASDPESDKIYINTSNNTTWRWSGTAMVQMNSGLALGTTSSTAYRGDHGLIAYTHAQTSGNPHNTQIGDISGLQGQLDGKAPVGHSHANATSTTYGFVKLGSDTIQNQASTAVSATASRTYAIQVDGSGKLVVNVPWTVVSYFGGTLNDLNAGASNQSMVWGADVIHDFVYNNFVSIADMGNPTVAVPDWSAALQTQTPNI